MTGLGWLWALSALGISAMALTLTVKARKLTLLTVEMTRRIALGAGDIRLAHWARTTMLTVTNQDGMITASTLEQLYTDHPGIDHTWADPIAVTLWSGGLTDMDQFQRDVIQFDRDLNELNEEHKGEA